MTFAYYLIITLHVIACFFLIAVVLLQQGKGQDLASAFGGGGSQTAFGPRGSATVLSRATAILAGVFVITSLSLSVLRPRSSILDTVPGAAAIHSSAFMPVVERRGPTNTSFAGAPGPPGARAAANPCWKLTGDSQVSRYSRSSCRAAVSLPLRSIHTSRRRAARPGR